MSIKRKQNYTLRNVDDVKQVQGEANSVTRRCVFLWFCGGPELLPNLAGTLGPASDTV